MKKILLIYFILPALVLANPPKHEGIVSSLNIGLRYSSTLQNRGVIYYDDFQIDPVVGIFFVDDQVEFLGDSLGFKKFIAKDWLRIRSKFTSLTDKPLFPARKSLKEKFYHRKDTYEWSNHLEFFLPGYNDNYWGEIDLTYAKDISAHQGNYFEILSKFKLFTFVVPKIEIKIEPNLFASLGWGDGLHNRYFYGPSAYNSGLNNLSYGLWFAFPDESDRYFPIIQLKHFQTLGINKNADYARDYNEGWLFSFIATYGVLE